jgi:hypothetical protein
MFEHACHVPEESQVRVVVVDYIIVDMFNILFNIIVIAKKNTNIYKVLSLDTTILSG